MFLHDFCLSSCVQVSALLEEARLPFIRMLSDEVNIFFPKVAFGHGLSHSNINKLRQAYSLNTLIDRAFKNLKFNLLGDMIIASPGQPLSLPRNGSQSTKFSTSCCMGLCTTLLFSQHLQSMAATKGPIHPLEAPPIMS